MPNNTSIPPAVVGVIRVRITKKNPYTNKKGSCSVELN